MDDTEQFSREIAFAISNLFMFEDEEGAALDVDSIEEEIYRKADLWMDEDYGADSAEYLSANLLYALLDNHMIDFALVREYALTHESEETE